MTFDPTKRTSFWMNVDPKDGWITRENADLFASDDRIGVARFDLVDGKLSVTLEPLEDKP